MLLTLYKTKDAANVLNKVLTEPKTVDINVRSDFDVINPVLFLMNEAGFNVRDYNYCEIPELNRKYFINEVTAVNNVVFRVDCECDVLETYKNDVLNSKARLKRNIKTGDYLDASLDMNVNKVSSTFESNKGFEGEPSLILTTVGV